MALNIEDARILPKRATTTGAVPTIPVSNNHTDGTWIPTDLYAGEFMFNMVDNKGWLRTNDGICDIPLINPTGQFSNRKTTFDFNSGGGTRFQLTYTDGVNTSFLRVLAAGFALSGGGTSISGNANNLIHTAAGYVQNNSPYTLFGGVGSLSGAAKIANVNHAFVAGFQSSDTGSADSIYTLPTAFPAGNGYVMASTTAGVMSWYNITGALGAYLPLAGNSAGTPITGNVYGGDGSHDWNIIADDTAVTSTITFLNGGALQLSNYNKGTLKTGYISVTPGQVYVSSNDAAFLGVVYAADYSANYTTRSLIDKGYAAATFAPIVAGGYLPKSGGTMTGTLILNADATNVLGAVTLQQLQSYVTGLWDDMGSFDASVNAYPSSGGSGTAGAILKGDIWTISVAGTLPTGKVVNISDTVRALVDTPGNTQGNWAIGEGNLGYTPLSNVLNSAQIFVGNASNVATGVTVSGAFTFDNAGVATLATVAVNKGGTGGTSAGITLFNNITGYTAAGATGTTSTNLVFSTSPTLVTPVLGVASGTSLTLSSLTTGRLTFATTSGLLTDSANLTYDGTNFVLTSTGSDILKVSGSGNGSMRSGILVVATNAAGQATNYMFNDRAATSSYGGQLYGGTTNATGNLFGVSRVDKYFIFADGASNLGMCVGTLGAQPLILGTNNSENLKIASGGEMTATGGGLSFLTVGKGITVKSGTNARAGNATLVGGTVTVSNNTVTANTLVMLTRKTSGGTIGTAITYTLSAGTSFTINSDNILDASTFSYYLIELN